MWKSWEKGEKWKIIKKKGDSNGVKQTWAALDEHQREENWRGKSGSSYLPRTFSFCIRREEELMPRVVYNKTSYKLFAVAIRARCKKNKHFPHISFNKSILLTYQFTP